MSERVVIDLGDYTPDTALPVEPEWQQKYADNVLDGKSVAEDSSVVICGMARSIGGILPVTIQRLEAIGSQFRNWAAVIVENDSEDDTKDVLHDWAGRRPGQVVVDCRDLGREHLRGFERARVERYAEYRNRYRELARDRFPHADYVLCVDLDPWGGYSLDGILSSVVFLMETRNGAGMASTSLYQALGSNGERVWCHYDQWAFRAYSFAVRFDPYFQRWLPPAGIDPIRVHSAFGAACLYRTEFFYECQYESVDGDIEHVGLHRNMHARGGRMFLNPASRVVMQWVP